MLTSDERRRMARRAMKKARLAELSPTEKLARSATKMLAKHGFYPKRSKREESVLEAEAIGQNGQLRATWVGRP